MSAVEPETGKAERNEPSTGGGTSSPYVWGWGLLLAVCASAAVGLTVHARSSSSAAATRGWHGKVVQVTRGGADASGSGLSVATSSGGREPLAEGAELEPGMRIATDGRTRARLSLDDESVVVLDRATEIALEVAPRTIRVDDGAVLADVAHVGGAPSAVVKTPHGDLTVLGTKFAVTAAGDRTNVEVLRGEVEIATGAGHHKVFAGQEGVVGEDGTIDVAPASDLAQRAAFGEELLATYKEEEATVSGLGELRAKRPGHADEKDHAVRLARHAVKIRIAGNVARTEIDETFANDTDDELEGIYRFPLPPGAQIERLALEVDGELLDGEFLDKARASAIWRGAIRNAAPKAPKPREEIVWVPGPWHDPALLEWQRGGRFELRIFPIPKRAARRVVIAYTETVAPVAGLRRYVYPLPQGSSSVMTIDRFSVDARVLGHDPKVPVRVRGYDLEKKVEEGAERLASTMTSFTPSGDLMIDYGIDDKASDVTAWAYRDERRAPSTADEVKRFVPASAGRRGSPRGPVSDDSASVVGGDPFVAIALRPKLPRWSESKPRDQVIVVDAGRTMYGERFARARRLAVQMIQEMDRRDRVAVIACDVSCAALPGGFVAPGAPSAHDVDAFLRGVTPDGASDLVGAVRAAAALAGHDVRRDRRIAVLSDGAATAGYRSPARVASGIADAVARAEALVVAVPIGADADVSLLSDVARGGGGVVVPYQPGQRLGSTALEVLNATYGTTLRDVEVVLPEGLYDRAPAMIAPLRAGGETIVTARMHGDSVKGDLVLRGKVGGDPFEARYPIDVRATTDAGNAFVPRLFAAARIADREREPGDLARSELVALSRRFAVPSRATSLLVLESEAMFEAFGIERTARGPRWTGEALALGVAATTGSSSSEPIFGALMGDEEAATSGLGALTEAKRDASGFGYGGGPGSAASAGDVVARSSAVLPAPTIAPPLAARPVSPKKGRFDDAPTDRFEEDQLARRPPGRFMKRIFVRRASVIASASPAVASDKITQARAAVAAAPDERSKHKELARALALAGRLDELSEALEAWSSRDPLDADVIVARADVAARRGDRGAALRILGGALAASALTPADAFVVAQAVGRSYDRLGKAEGCAFHIAAAELRGSDPDALARAIACERAQGRAEAAERWLVGLRDAQRAAVSASITKLEAQRSERTFGDIVVSATWSGDVDLDVVLVDPSGRRAGVVSRLKNARVSDATSRERETVALSSGEAGSFLVEMVRTDVTDAFAEKSPIVGTVTVKALGQSRSIPFNLKGARAQVGRVDVRWEPELVPIDEAPTFVPRRPSAGVSPPWRTPPTR